MQYINWRALPAMGEGTASSYPNLSEPYNRDGRLEKIGNWRVRQFWRSSMLELVDCIRISRLVDHANPKLVEHEAWFWLAPSPQMPYSEQGSREIWTGLTQQSVSPSWWRVSSYFVYTCSPHQKSMVSSATRSSAPVQTSISSTTPSNGPSLT